MAAVVEVITAILVMVTAIAIVTAANMATNKKQVKEVL